MTWAVIIARTFVGLVYLVLGLDYFFHFMSMPKPEQPELAAKFGELLFVSHYLAVVKVFEILGAVNLLTGRYALLGIAILLPISVNILLFDVLLVKGFGAGYVLVPLLLFVLFGYRNAAKPVFDGTARIG